MNGKTITTMLDTTTAEVVEIYAGHTRDQIILIREAVHSLRTEAAREIKVTVLHKDFTLTVEARK